ncbi:hypothetical protein [Streptomyces sp. NPDC008141]|uniref:hypothetical protein n=1 Tax=Streptomyces sp. NPDC008141 TaxID=3364815 RepID=UPI0036ED799E
MFVDPAVRALYPDWQGVAHTGVAQQRMIAPATHVTRGRQLSSGGRPSRTAGFRCWWAPITSPWRVLSGGHPPRAKWQIV